MNEQTTSLAWPKPAVAWFMVGVLVLAFIFSIADRIIIALLVEPIQLTLSEFMVDCKIQRTFGPTNNVVTRSDAGTERLGHRVDGGQVGPCPEHLQRS